MLASAISNQPGWNLIVAHPTHQLLDQGLQQEEFLECRII